MGWIVPAQGNWKLMEVDVWYTCRTRQAKLSILAKEAWCDDVPFMNVSIASLLMPVGEQGTNVTVGTVAKINLLMNRPFV